MKRITLLAALSACLMFGAVTLSTAAGKAHDPSDDDTPRPRKEASHKPNPKVEAKKQEAAKMPLIDINGATKQELMKLPGIGDPEAARIIAGRPYGSKAHLVSRNILSSDAYHALKTQVIAKQPNKDAGKNAELYAPKQEKK